jgi:hypothetical protein
MGSQQLSREMIRRYLEEDGAEYDVDEEGGFSFSYDYDDECACELTVWLTLPHSDIYTIEVHEERTFPRSESDRLLRICNTWNERERYPIAILYPEDVGPEEVEIRLVHTYIARAATQQLATQQQVRDFTEEMIEKSFAFWKWAHQEHGL